MSKKFKLNNYKFVLKYEFKNKNFIWQSLNYSMFKY